MAIPANTPSVQSTQTSRSQEVTAPKQKEIDRKSTLVGSEKMYKAAETVTTTISNATKATSGFVKGVATKIGLIKEKATDTIGKSHQESSKPPSKAEVRKSQNAFISYIDKSANLIEELEKSTSTPETKLEAYKELEAAFSKLPPKEREFYQPEMEKAQQAAIKTSDKDKIGKIMKEILETEKSFLRSVQNVNKDLVLLEQNGKIPKKEMEKLKADWKELENEVSKNVAAFSKLENSKIPDAEKLQILQQHLNLNANSPFGKVVQSAVGNYEKGVKLAKKADPTNNAIESNMISVVQRGPRYVLLMQDLSKSHDDLIFKDIATSITSNVQSNMQRINGSLAPAK